MSSSTLYNTFSPPVSPRQSKPNIRAQRRLSMSALSAVPISPRKKSFKNVPEWMTQLPEFTGDPDEVWHRIIVWSVDEICTGDQTFSINVAIRYGWYDPDVPDHVIKDYPDLDKGEKLSDEATAAVFAKQPGFDYPDAKDFDIYESVGPYVAEVPGKPGCELTMFTNARITITDAVNISDFPFDIQDFHFRINIYQSSGEHNAGYWNDNWHLVTERGTTDIASSAVSLLQTNNQRTPQFSLHGFKMSDDWESRDGFFAKEGWEIVHTECSLGKTGWESCITYSFLSKRKSWFYSLNILSVTTLMSFFTFMGFAVGPDDVSDRLAYDITILLTVVALKFSFTDAIPVVPYNTLVDWKIWLTTTLVFWVTFSHALIGYYARKNDDVESIDDFVSLCWLIATCVLEGLFWVYAARKSCSRASDRLTQKGNETTVDRKIPREQETDLPLISPASFDTIEQKEL